YPRGHRLLKGGDSWAGTWLRSYIYKNTQKPNLGCRRKAAISSSDHKTLRATTKVLKPRQLSEYSIRLITEFPIPDKAIHFRSGQSSPVERKSETGLNLTCPSLL